MTNEDQIKSLEKRVKDINDTKVRKTEQLRLLREQRDNLVTQLTSQGLDPNTLKTTIQQLEAEINTEIENLKTIVPNV